MRVRLMAITVILASFTGAVGYYLGATTERPVTEMPADASVALEYLVSPESFSEVERVSSMLDAIAVSYREQARSVMVQEFLQRGGTALAEVHGRDNRFLYAIGLLEEGAAEFRGTRQELILIPTLLFALKHAGLHDRWLNTYLDALYRHPTAEKMMELAGDAMRIAHAVGREDEVAFGLMYVERIPSNHEHLHRAGDAVNDVRPWFHRFRS